MGPGRVGPGAPKGGRTGYQYARIVEQMMIARAKFPHKLGPNVKIATITAHPNFLLSMKGSSPAAVHIQFAGQQVNVIVSGERAKTALGMSIRKAGLEAQGRYEHVLCRPQLEPLPLLAGLPIPLAEAKSSKGSEYGAVLIPLKGQKGVFRVEVLREDISVNINIEPQGMELNPNKFPEIFAKNHKPLQEIMLGSVSAVEGSKPPEMAYFPSPDDPKITVPVWLTTVFMSKKDGSVTAKVSSDEKENFLEMQLYLLYVEAKKRSVLEGKFVYPGTPQIYEDLLVYYKENFREINGTNGGLPLGPSK